MVLLFSIRSAGYWTTNRIFDKCLSVLKNFQFSRINKQILPNRLNSSYLQYVSQRNYSQHVKQPGCLRGELLCNIVEPVQDGLNKVTIVGAGTVGLACLNAILFQKISSHVALIDAFPKKLKGEGLDYAHGLTFLKDPQFEYDTDFCISSNSKVVIITIGARQLKNETRLDLVQRNADILKTIILPLADYSPKAVFIIVTNPVDIMAWLAWKISGLPVNRVIGSGTHLDTARFRHMIANRIGVASQSVEGYVVGEHGESQVPLWSSVSCGGCAFSEILPNFGMSTDEEKWFEIAKDVVNAGSTIRCLKGHSNVAIGLAVADIAKAVLRNSQAVKCVSTLVQGHHEVCQEMFLSLPCTIGERGVGNVLRVRMTEHERKMFQASAAHVYKFQKDMRM